MIQVPVPIAYLSGFDTLTDSIVKGPQQMIVGEMHSQVSEPEIMHFIEIK